MDSAIGRCHSHPSFPEILSLSQPKTGTNLDSRVISRRHAEMDCSRWWGSGFLWTNNGRIDGGCATAPPRVMKLLSWNSRGLGNSCGIRSLCDLLKQEDFDLVFLQETKVLASFFTSWKFYLDYQFGLAIDCDGKSGGLALLWKEDFHFKISHYSPNFIHGILNLDIGRDKKCYVIGVYGSPEASSRPFFWEHMKGFTAKWCFTMASIWWF